MNLHVALQTYCNGITFMILFPLSATVSNIATHYKKSLL